MLHSCIILFILTGVLHSSNCLQRSDYIYDRETRMVTLTTNGTTYTCRASDITGPTMERFAKSVRGPCLNDVESADDPNCVRKEFVNVINEMAKWMNKEDGPSSCDAPIPSVEETLDRIKQVYRSSSLDDNPVTVEWFTRTIKNAAQLKTECEDNGTRKLYPAMLKDAAKFAASALILGGRELPELRGNVSEAQTVLEEAKKKEAQLRADVLRFDRDDFHEFRETLYAMEISALESSDEFQLSSWIQVEESRISFVDDIISQKKKLEYAMSVAAQEVVEAELDMLSKMAKANAMLARIYALMKEADNNLERACESTLLDYVD